MQFKQLLLEVLQRDLVSYTPLPAVKSYTPPPFLVSNQFKVLCILQTVNFQGKVCHLRLAAGRPGKCR